MKLKKWVKVTLLFITFIALFTSLLIYFAGVDSKAKMEKEVQEQIKPVEEQPSVESKPEEPEVFTKENYDKIAVGEMTTGNGGTPVEEVLVMFGDPHNTAESQQKDTAIKVMVWTAKASKVSITSVNGLVVDKTFVEIK